MPRRLQRSTKGTWHERERDGDDAGGDPGSRRGRRSNGAGGGFLSGPVGRNLGLVIALAILCIVGVVTAGDRFADVDNVLTILRLASVIGVVSVGMTFVIIGGGIDLSVGALVASSSVWATTLATQAMAEDFHWIVMVVTAIVVGAGAGLVNGVVIAYGKLVAFIATLAMLVAARGLAEILANRRTQIVQNRDFLEFFSGDVLGIPTLVIILALVAIAGWVLLNRTTFGRRTFAVGGNAEAARLAGIRVQRHTREALRAVRRLLRHRRRDDHGADDDRQLHPRHALRAVRHRRRRHRRHPADRRPRHHRRHRPRRADLHHARQRLHAEQPVELGPGRRDQGVIIVLAVLLQMRLAEGGGGPSWLGRRGSPPAAGGAVATGAPSGAVSGGTSVPGAPGGDRPGGAGTPTT